MIVTDIRELLQRAADVPTGLPDVESAWRSARQRQRRRATVVAVVAAAVVAVGLGTATVVLDDDRREQVPAVEPAPVRPVPPRSGPLDAGVRYDASALGLPFVVSVPGPGWTLAARSEGWVSLHHGPARVNLQRWTTIYRPVADPPTRRALRPVPDDLVAWIRDHPRLRVTDERPVDVAGESWVALDLRVSDPLTTRPVECGARPCVLLAALGSEPVDLLASETATILVETSALDPVVVLVARPTSVPGEQPVLDELVSLLSKGTP